MSMTTLEIATISRGRDMAKKLVEEIKPILDELNITYDSAGGVKSTLTQAKLDSSTSLSGLTKAQLDDAMYALTATIRTDLANAYAQLSQLATRE